MSNFLWLIQLPSIPENISNVTDTTDLALAAINVFQNHSSIKNIIAKNFKSVFSLRNTNEIEI